MICFSPWRLCSPPASPPGKRAEACRMGEQADGSSARQDSGGESRTEGSETVARFIAVRDAWEVIRAGEEREREFCVCVCVCARACVGTTRGRKFRGRDDLLCLENRDKRRSLSHNILLKYSDND